MNACLIVLSVLCAQSAAARRVAREVVESFGREAVEAAEPRVLRLVEAYGEEAGMVLRRVGPSGIQAVERFGASRLRIPSRFRAHRGRLVALAGDAAFLHDPKPYIEGLKQLAVEPATQVAHDAATRTNWTLVVISAILIASVWLGIRWAWATRRSRVYVLDSPGGRP